MGLGRITLGSVEFLAGDFGDGTYQEDNSTVFVADLPDGEYYLAASGAWIKPTRPWSTMAYIAESNIISQPAVVDWIRAQGYEVPVPV